MKNNLAGQLKKLFTGQDENTLPQTNNDITDNIDDSFIDDVFIAANVPNDKSVCRPGEC